MIARWLRKGWKEGCCPTHECSRDNVTANERMPTRQHQQKQNLCWRWTAAFPVVGIPLIDFDCRKPIIVSYQNCKFNWRFSRLAISQSISTRLWYYSNGEFIRIIPSEQGKSSFSHCTAAAAGYFNLQQTIKSNELDFAKKFALCRSETFSHCLKEGSQAKLASGCKWQSFGCIGLSSLSRVVEVYNKLLPLSHGTQLNLTWSTVTLIVKCAIVLLFYV